MAFAPYCDISATAETSESPKTWIINTDNKKKLHKIIVLSESLLLILFTQEEIISIWQLYLKYISRAISLYSVEDQASSNEFFFVKY